MQKSNIDYLIEYWPFIISLLFLLLAKNRMGIISMDKALFIFLLVNSLFFLFKFGMSALRNASPKLIANDYQTTYTGNWTPVGNYIVFRSDGIRAMDIEMEMNGGTVIVPKDAVNPIGKIMGSISLASIGYGLLHGFVIAYTEEVVFRGIFMNVMGIIPSILLFGLFHYGISGYSIVSVLILMLFLGLPASLIARKFGLMGAVGYHFAWNCKAYGILDSMLKSMGLML